MTKSVSYHAVRELLSFHIEGCQDLGLLAGPAYLCTIQDARSSPWEFRD